MTSGQTLPSNGNPYEGPELNDGKSPEGRSVIGTVFKLFGLAAIGVVVIGLFIPNFNRGREIGDRSQCKNNLKMIAVALHNYHDVLRIFPTRIHCR